MNPYHEHKELFDTLVEFYTLQIQLGNLPNDALKVSNSDVFNAEAALQAGFSPEAVRVLMHLPYLDSDHDFFEILPNTIPERYTEPQLEGNAGFSSRRELDTNRGDGVLLPPSFIKLTYQSRDGHVLLYDTKTRLMRDWIPSADDIDKDNYDFDLIPANPPREVLGRWIGRYRRLSIVKYYSHTNWDIYSSIPRSMETEGATDRFLSEQRRLAEAHIQTIYLDCGWDVESKDQDRFDLDKFMNQREVYVKRAINPVKEQIAERQRSSE